MCGFSNIIWPDPVPLPSPPPRHITTQPNIYASHASASAALSSSSSSSLKQVLCASANGRAHNIPTCKGDLTEGCGDTSLLSLCN
uniref:Uncharacterized protein n=1 Tax=Mesocestoides corti TaxID=53468 RepID=A0A5K3EGK0_MESCO